MYRQGDVLLRKIDNVSPYLQFQEVGKEYVVAEGEKTGHKHKLASNGGIQIAGYGIGGGLTATLAMPGVLTHDEHAPIELEPGTYGITQEQELDHADRRMHDVAD